MKAILVVDVDEFTYEAFKEYFTGDIALCLGNDGLYDLKDVELKPMPEKSDYSPKDDHAYSKEEIMAYTYGIAVGRNEVIDEIMGEQNETTGKN